jgi:hypothetical protein
VIDKTKKPFIKKETIIRPSTIGIRELQGMIKSNDVQFQLTFIDTAGYNSLKGIKEQRNKEWFTEVKNYITNKVLPTFYNIFLLVSGSLLIIQIHIC